MRFSHIVSAAVFCLAAAQAQAAPVSVLWWDSTPDYGGQAPNSYRQQMADALTAFNGGASFAATYVGSEVAGTLATHLSGNSYDVVVFDATSFSPKFDTADLDAVKAMYAGGKKSLMLDGILYIRNIVYSADTLFPGPGGALAGLLINQVAAIAEAGGGFLVGTDHQGYQEDANQIVRALVPGAAFTGITSPSTDGVFFGDTLLNGPVPIAANDVLTHWSAVPSQGIAPTGLFDDFLGDEIELFSLVDVADTIGGPRASFVSFSVKPGDRETDVDDDTPGGGGVAPVPVPAAALLLGSALFGLGAFGRRRRG
jgi:hypothetical protein